MQSVISLQLQWTSVTAGDSSSAGGESQQPPAVAPEQGLPSPGSGETDQMLTEQVCSCFRVYLKVTI